MGELVAFQPRSVEPEQKALKKMMKTFLAVLLIVALVSVGSAVPWYQGPKFNVPGRPQSDEKPTGCVDGEPAGWYNNGYPMLCAEGEVCDPEIAEQGLGNPCMVPAEK